MQQPPGYVEEGQEELVCKLEKSLYGLKQSPRCWNMTFRRYIRSIGFRESDADSCNFVRNDSKLSIVALYVDDLILVTKEKKK